MINVKTYNDDESYVNVEFFHENKSDTKLQGFSLIINAANDFRVSDHDDYYQLHLGTFDILSHVNIDEKFDRFVLYNGVERSYEIEANNQIILKSEFYSNFSQHLTLGSWTDEATEEKQFSKVGMYLEVSQIEDYDKWNLDVSIKKIIEVLEKCINLDDELSIFVDQPDEEDRSLFFMIIEMGFKVSDNIRNSVNRFAEKMYLIEEQVFRELDPLKWKEEYLNDEKKFTLELALPLFRRLRYDSVKYTHGKKEYGKDMVCSYTDPLGEKKYVAIQLKAGDMSGRVRSDIDEIIAQLEDAMSIPYSDVTIGKEVYISQFIILISGKFTENAQHKILTKIPYHQKGLISFIDRSKLMDLLKLHW